MSARPSFIALGECMIELAQEADGRYRRGFAGDTFNTAWYARRLLPPDWSVAYGGCVGEDAASAEMAAFMAGEGIDVSALRAVPGRTVGLYMIDLVAGERSFSYWRGQSAARRLGEDSGWLDAILAGRRIAHFSGITLAILPPEDRARFCAALARARAAGTRIAFDTNLRPRLWEDAAAMRAGLALGASVADVVLPSFDEEAALFGDATPAETARRYLAAGAGLVAVKDGGRPLTLLQAGTEAHVGAEIFRPPETEPVDTTAAGDSFAAGLLCHMALGRSAAEAAEAAMALAAGVIGHRGALARALFDMGEGP